MNIDGILDGPAIRGAGVIRRKRSPADDRPFEFSNGDWVFNSMMIEPPAATAHGFQYFLVRAGRVENVMIVDIVDGLEIRSGGGTNDNLRACFIPTNSDWRPHVR